jgi:hypothetical protein
MPDPLSGIPSQFEAGDTVIFTESFPDYAPGTYTAALVMNNGVAAATTVNATTSGTSFLFTITAAVSAAYTPGQYTFAIYATSGSTRYTAKSGVVNILPNLTATATPSFAQAQVTLLKVVIAELNTTSKQSVNFNGQSFSRANIADYQKQLTYYRAEVIRETAAANAARGITTGNRIAIQFMPANNNNPVTITQ